MPLCIAKGWALQEHILEPGIWLSDNSQCSVNSSLCVTYFIVLFVKNKVKKGLLYRLLMPDSVQNMQEKCVCVSEREIVCVSPFNVVNN